MHRDSHERQCPEDYRPIVRRERVCDIRKSKRRHEQRPDREDVERDMRDPENLEIRTGHSGDGAVAGGDGNSAGDGLGGEKGGRRRSARVELPCDVDAASASAKFSKKRGQLTVVLAPSAD